VRCRATANQQQKENNLGAAHTRSHPHRLPALRSLCEPAADAVVSRFGPVELDSRRREAGDPDAVYRFSVAKSVVPSDGDESLAIGFLLRAVASGAPLADIARDLEPLHPHNNTFPGEVMLEVAADAMTVAGFSRATPVEFRGIVERHLAEHRISGNTARQKMRYALFAAAALHGGACPDLLADVAWYQADDFWVYAMYAAVLLIRAAAERTGMDARDVCTAIARQHTIAL
jgi:hypothetical protein